MRRTIGIEAGEEAEEPLSTETDSDFHCEGRVRTCAHCGRPATECDGTNCEHLLETRDWMIPGYSTG
jgi:hypothetical protein